MERGREREKEGESERAREREQEREGKREKESEIASESARERIQCRVLTTRGLAPPATGCEPLEIGKRKVASFSTKEKGCEAHLLARGALGLQPLPPPVPSSSLRRLQFGGNIFRVFPEVSRIQGFGVQGSLSPERQSVASLHRAPSM